MKEIRKNFEIQKKFKNFTQTREIFVKISIENFEKIKQISKNYNKFEQISNKLDKRKISENFEKFLKN